MNFISIAGNVGKDAETRFLPDGTAVLSFSVADNQGKDKPTIWWNCSMFGKRGEALQQYVTKGSQVTVVGKVSEREWTDKDGQKRKSMDVRVEDVALQGGRDRSEAAPRPAPPRAAAASTPALDAMDDDIPFAVSLNDFLIRPSKERRLSRCEFK